MATQEDNPFIDIIDGLDESVEEESTAVDVDPGEGRGDDPYGLDDLDTGEKAEDDDNHGEDDTPESVKGADTGVGDRGQKADGKMVPLGVVNELRAKLREERETNRKILDRLDRMESKLTIDDKGKEEDDPYLEFRDMTPGELEEYASQGSEERKIVVAFYRQLDKEREDRLANRLTSAPKEEQAEADRQAAAASFQKLKGANEWLQNEDSNAYLIFSNAYERSTAGTLQGRLREAMTRVAPVLRAEGLRLQGLQEADPEFFASLSASRKSTGKPKPHDPTVRDLSGGKSGRGKQRLEVGSRTNTTDLSQKLSKMSSEERMRWLDEPIDTEI